MTMYDVIAYISENYRHTGYNAPHGTVPHPKRFLHNLIVVYNLRDI